MTLERDNAKTEHMAREALDQNLRQIPEEITSALEAARKKALATAQEDSVQSGARVYHLDRPKIIWGGAVAASVTALALSIALQQPGQDLPASNGEELLGFAEIGALDETEWALIQDLEFALWLSQLSDDAFATDPQG